MVSTSCSWKNEFHFLKDNLFKGIALSIEYANPIYIIFPYNIIRKSNFDKNI